MWLPGGTPTGLSHTTWEPQSRPLRKHEKSRKMRKQKMLNSKNPVAPKGGPKATQRNPGSTKGPPGKPKGGPEAPEGALQGSPRWTQGRPGVPRRVRVDPGTPH